MERTKYANWLALTALIAFAYYLGAALGQILAIPPGYITLVWPPSGLALAVVLIYGPAALPGIFIGAFASNVHLDQGAPGAILLSAALIGAGSSLQPLAGRYLLTRFGVAWPFGDYRARSRFVLTALLVPVVSAVIGPAGLTVTGILQANQVRTLLTWWAGDGAGILVFTPLTLYLLNQSFRSDRKRFLALIMIMAGTSFTIVILAITSSYSTYLESQGQRMRENAQMQARLMESVARLNPQDPTGRVMLDELESAYQTSTGFSATGQYQLARRTGDSIEYLVSYPPSPDPLPTLPFAPSSSQPMFRALSGEAGYMIGTDYRGIDVLAAYEPVAGLDVGLVVKTDMREIRRPYIQSTAVLILVTLVLVALSIRWFQSISAPLIDSLRRQSVDLQKLVDEQTLELRANETRFKALLDSSPEAMVIVDTRGCIVLVNNKLCTISGFSTQELIGQNIEILVPTKMRDHHIGLRDGYIRDPKPRLLDAANFQLLCQRKDGLTFPVAISLNAIDTPTGQLVAAAIRDVSEQKAYEDKLIRAQHEAEEARKKIHDSQQLLEGIVDNGSYVIYVKHKDGKYMFVNKEFVKFGGQPREMIVGKDDSDIFGPEIGGKLRENDLSVMNSGTLATYFEDAWGRVFLSNKFPLYDIDGNVSGLCGLSADVTEQKNLERELTKAKALAEAATQAKATFLASMSHEIRTPMNAVIGMVDLVRQTQLTNEQSEMLQTVSQSGQSLLTIINDILDFSKIESGKLELESISFPLAESIEGAVKTVSINAQAKGLGLLTYVDPALPSHVYGDPVRLRQIVINLVGNAIKFTEKGKVLVRVSLLQQQQDRVTLRVAVKDRGIGISREGQQNLFREFTQAESSTTRKYGGTGLGLSICKRLAELMGGSIRVESELGHGSEFSVELGFPIDTTKSAEVDSKDLFTDVSIVVVDRNADEVEMLRSYLFHMGASVQVCDSFERCKALCSAAAAAGKPVHVALVGSDWARGEQFALAPQLPGTRVIALIIGKRSQPRIQTEDTLTLDIVPFTSTGLINAVSIALGRASPSVHYEKPEDLKATGRLLTIAEAEAANTLILVAEDNPTNRDVIGRQLRLLGYTCEMTEDGKQALQAWESGRYRILLTDCHMPEMDGFELTAAIRAHEHNSGTTNRFPIVAITANALQGEAERCIAAGMDGYMSKPIDIKELRNTLRRYFAQAPVQTEAPPTAAGSGQGKAAAPVDESVLKGMFGDDAQMFREILTDFIAPSETIIGEIHAAWDKGSAQGVQQATHKLKSAARSIGANALADVCMALEQAGKENRLAAATDAMARLDGLMADVIAYIRLV